MNEGAWNERLRAARRMCGLTQAELARMAGLSMQTVRAYERQRRHPTRAHLAAMLDAMRIERGERNAIFTAAGFAPDGRSLRPQAAGFPFTAAEAARETERYRWPAFVTDEFATVLSANVAARKLFGVADRGPNEPPRDRNMFSVLSDPAFADRFLNWDEAASIVVLVFKSHYRGREDIEHPSPQFRVTLDRFFKGEPRYVARFLELWQSPEQAEPKIRWAYPVRWRAQSGGVLQFHCFVSIANDDDGLAFHDWIPLDGATWAELDRLRRA